MTVAKSYQVCNIDGLGPLLFSPLSEIYFIGRNPVYFGTFILFAAFTALTAIVENFTGFIILRFLQAFFGSPCLATGAASLGDMVRSSRCDCDALKD